MRLHLIVLKRSFSFVSPWLSQAALVLFGLAWLCAWQARADVPDASYELKVRQSGFVGMPMEWVGTNAPSETESRALWEALGAGQIVPRPDAAANLENFVKAHSESPWRPTIEDHLGTYYRDTGYFSLALSHWEASWNAAKGMKDVRGNRVADEGLLDWLQLLASLGRTDEMATLLQETKDRAMPKPWQMAYMRMAQAYRHMLRHPEDSYRCGTFALNAVGKALYGTNFFHQIAQLPSPESGFSMAELVRIAESNNLDLVAVERPSGGELVAPSLVHWKENHYAAIVEQKGDMFRVVDPTFRLAQWLSTDAINHEASGQFLVSAKRIPKGWRTLTATDCKTIFGKGYPEGGNQPPPGVPGCNGDSGGGPMALGACSSCQSGAATSAGGMPTWQVTEPDIMLWLTDEPLAYQTATGGRISFKYYYHPANLSFGSLANPVDGIYPVNGVSFTWNWKASWLSYVSDYPGGGSGISLFPLGGGQRLYTNWDGTQPEYYTQTRLVGITNSSTNLAGFNLFYPSGAEDVYAFYATNAATVAGYPIYFLSQQIDAHGRTTTYAYNTNYMLQYIVDCDRNTNTFTYEWNPNAGSSNLLVRITNPFGKYATFGYSTNSSNYTVASGVILTNVVDAAGNSTSFAYSDSYDVILSSMTTPYGTTSFDYANGPNSWGLDLSFQYCIVTEADGGQQMFMFAQGNDFPGVPEVYTNTSNVPTNRPQDIPGGTNTLDNPDWNNSHANDYMNYATSFYWNRQQFPNLSSGFLNSLVSEGSWDFDYLTNTDYGNGRMRHWNQTQEGPWASCQGFTLSMEALPSPDGVTPGKMTWWDYPNKPAYNVDGSSGNPTLMIQVQPNGSNWYQLYGTDQWGNRTNMISTYSSNGVVMLRTNKYVYSTGSATNSADLLLVIDPEGFTNVAYGGYTNHLPQFMTNAVGYVTTYTYNTNFQLTGMTAQQTGLVTTNIYNSSNRLSTNYSYNGTTYFGTNTYTYTNDLVYTQTDPRGLTTTSSWDNLERLTNVAYPDGTHISYVYSNLDLVRVVDRLVYTNSFTYDPIRRRLSATDANGHTLYYAYCNCGGLAYITNALSQVTHYEYDNQGNLTTIFYPDSYDIFNTYNAIKQLIVRTDGSGVSVSNWFNNQGGLIAVSNAAGQVLARNYDMDDRVVSSVDQNGVATTNTFDNLSRLVTKKYPDGGQEGFLFSAFGLIAYTNQLANITHYAYDASLRKIAETNALNNLTQYAYSPASDLTSLTDPNTRITKWSYDQYGRMTNKMDAMSTTILTYQYDANSRLTNRWSLAKTNTIYAYDNVGNLTNVTYQSGQVLKFSYDNFNELTSMSDAIGTTRFTYTSGQQLASETGPWASDSISYAYTDRLRTLLDLQQPNTSDWVHYYTYDMATRMTGITSPAGTFSYTYNAGVGGASASSTLISKLALPNGAWITNTFDNNGRMLGTWLTNSTSNIDSSVYTYNVGNQRTTVIRTGENTASYAYDPIGEVVSDLAAEGPTNRLNEQLHYAFDPAGNLNYRTNNTLIANFTVNYDNELTASTNGGRLTVMGTATSTATNVTVNATNIAQRYGDSTFAATNFPILSSYTAVASDNLGRRSTNTVNVNINTNNTSYVYDGDGNLTFDGLRNFAYDGENQLVQVWVTSNWFSQFSYDGKMRRRIRQEYTWQGGQWVQTNEVYYVYDGNVVVQERNINNLPTTTYTRGNDVSSSLQGAGGIGGLLAMTLNFEPGTLNSNSFFYHSDGNGNVTMLLNGSQYIVAKYLYDAFGNVLSAAGSLAQANLYRFSSKEAHVNSGLVYYLYRYYDANLQRWPNRDPNNEIGNMELRGGCIGCDVFLRKEPFTYRFCANSPENRHDPFGLDDSDCLAALQKAMVAAAAAGAKCALIGTVTGVGGVLAGLGTGAVVGTTDAGPGWGTVAGVCVAGGVEIYDWIHFHHCMNKVQEMKDKAQKDYEACMAKANQ